MADQQQATEAVSASTEVKSTEQATAVPQPTTVEPKTPAKVDQQPEDSGDEDDDEDESSPSTPSRSGSAKKRVVKNRGRIKRVKKTPQKESATDSSPAKSTKTGHHLENTWTFWFSKKPSKMNPAFNWVESLRKLGTFNTVEDFWRYYTWLKRPTEIINNSNIYMFKDEIEPMWENFPNGGCWTLRIKKKSPVIGKWWEELLFAAIGEALQEPDIVGVSVSVKPKEEIFSIWNRDASAKPRVGEKLRHLLGLDASCPMEYKSNSSSERKAAMARTSSPLRREDEGANSPRGELKPEPTAEQVTSAASPVVEAQQPTGEKKE
jgi:translation initiation factor 4E